jgi:uncharacterized membrane protein YgcG
VNDEAGLLSADVRHELERQLVQYEAETQHQLAILTIRSLDGSVPG